MTTHLRRPSVRSVSRGTATGRLLGGLVVLVSSSLLACEPNLQGVQTGERRPDLSNLVEPACQLLDLAENTRFNAELEAAASLRGYRVSEDNQAPENPPAISYAAQEAALVARKIAEPAETYLGRRNTGAGVYVLMTTMPGYRADSLAGTFTFQSGSSGVLGGVGFSTQTDQFIQGPSLGVRATIVPLIEKE